MSPSPFTFLVASPHLRGGYFGDSVILLLEHSTEGALGLVINHALDTPVSELLEEVGGARGGAMLGNPAYLGGPAFLGGPVQPQVGWCLYERPVGEPERQEESAELQLGTGLVATTDLATFARVRASGQPWRLLLGYAGWDAGQLEAETREGAWLWLETGDADLLWDTPTSECWTRALGILGVDPRTVAAGGAQA